MFRFFVSLFTSASLMFPIQTLGAKYENLAEKTIILLAKKNSPKLKTSDDLLEHLKKTTKESDYKKLQPNIIPGQKLPNFEFRDNIILFRVGSKTHKIILEDASTGRFKVNGVTVYFDKTHSFARNAKKFKEALTKRSSDFSQIFYSKAHAAGCGGFCIVISIMAIGAAATVVVPLIKAGWGKVLCKLSGDCRFTMKGPLTEENIQLANDVCSKAKEAGAKGCEIIRGKSHPSSSPPATDIGALPVIGHDDLGDAS